MKLYIDCLFYCFSKLNLRSSKISHKPDLDYECCPRQDNNILYKANWNYNKDIVYVSLIKLSKISHKPGLDYDKTPANLEYNVIIIILFMRTSFFWLCNVMFCFLVCLETDLFKQKNYFWPYITKCPGLFWNFPINLVNIDSIDGKGGFILHFCIGRITNDR